MFPTHSCDLQVHEIFELDDPQSPQAHHDSLGRIQLTQGGGDRRLRADMPGDDAREAGTGQSRPAHPFPAMHDWRSSWQQETELPAQRHRQVVIAGREGKAGWRGFIS